MMNSSCAPARASTTYAHKRGDDASATRGPGRRRYTYTPELMPEGSLRYGRIEDGITEIAVDFGIYKSTFQRLAVREHWAR